MDEPPPQLPWQSLRPLPPGGRFLPAALACLALLAAAAPAWAASGPPGGVQIDPWVGLGLGLFFVALNGFFVAAEFALVKVRPTQIDPHVTAGLRRGRVARHMVRHLDAYLSATQLGITLASLALGWIGEPAFAWLIEPLVLRLPGAGPAMVHSIALTFAFLTITILHIVLGELAPKSLAIRKPEATTLAVSLPLYAFYKLAFPAIWLLNHAANALLKLIGVAPVSESEMGHDEEELRLLLASSHASVLSQQKRELLANVFAISNRITRQIMVPRGDVAYLSTTRSLEDNLRLARESGHTRLPLCDGDLDHVIGLVHIKDLFRHDEPLASLESVAREIAFIPESLTVDRLLRRMRVERLHLAAVLDEYGGVSGIVTLENVIEEIVGQIQDEFDLETPELVKKREGVWVVSGALLVDELEQALNVEFSDRDEDTIGGVMMSEIGRTPIEGDEVTLGPLQLRVVEVDSHRVKRVRVAMVAPQPTRP
ncbi:MAG TPA: hemolysin family protein [Thermoanaerobaculia bacterium]|nr:hemolysin family protein [Thermoanaerobaculia bacterium]